MVIGKERDVKRILNAAIAGAVLSVLAMGAQAQPPGGAPFAGMAKMTCAEALAKISRDNSDIGKLAKSFDADAAKLKKSPKDAKVKKAYVESGVNLEQKIYNGAGKLSSPIRYRASLALCRMVLTVDPKNTVCKMNMDKIVEIYKGMHMEVPK